MQKLFGTDGIRGVANIYPMTAELAMQVGRAVAYIFRSRGGSRRRKVVIGKDTRLSGYMLEQAIASGVCSMGADAVLLGPMPTPGIAYITHDIRADAGIVISASHNAFQDNGIKIFSADGFKLPDKMEEQIENLLYSGSVAALRPTAEQVGKSFRMWDAIGRYVSFLKNTFPSALDLSDLKVVVDAANGAAYRIAPMVFEELGAHVTAIGVAPNGTNINADCGALHPGNMCEVVKETGADIGIALDGDADRLVVCDENGAHVHGDAIIALCGKAMLEEERLPHGTVVATCMSNLALDHVMKEVGGSVIRTDVGDRYVLASMREGGYSFGGEQSGHLIFLEHGTTGDGMLAALQLLAIMVRSQKPLSELASVLQPLPQVLRNVKVRDKRDLETLPQVTQAIGEIESSLGESGRVLVRYSGTEPKLRIMVEGDDEAVISGYAEQIAERVQECIGA